MLYRPRTPVLFENSFASTPYANKWSFINELKAHEVSKALTIDFLFYCDVCNHTYEAMVRKITNGQPCPHCTGQRYCIDPNCGTCTQFSFAGTGHAHKLLSTGGIEAHQLAKNSNECLVFECNVCDHVYAAIVSKITAGQPCLFCSGKWLCFQPGCNMCTDRSIASCLTDNIRWSNKNNIGPLEVFKGSHTKYYFKCGVCHHTFKMAANHVARGCSCNYCDNKVLCQNMNCMICEEKSFFLSHRAGSWSPLNNISPRMVFKCTNVKYIFDCDICKHSFTIALSRIHTDNAWCQYCAKKRLCTDLKCDFCFKNSFASHPKSIYWSKKNDTIPRMVLKSSGFHYKFRCPYCRRLYIASLSNVSKGKWCSCTTYKTEKKLYEFLKLKYPNLKIIRGKKFDWCKNKTHLPFDFFIKKLNLIIELDGNQHFTKVKSWKSTPAEVQKTDVKKMKLANQHNYSVVRIYQPDVWDDKNNWENNLTENIKKYNKPVNIFIGDIYSLHPNYKLNYGKKSEPLADLSSSESESESESESISEPSCESASESESEQNCETISDSESGFNSESGTEDSSCEEWGSKQATLNDKQIIEI